MTVTSCMGCIVTQISLPCSFSIAWVHPAFTLPSLKLALERGIRVPWKEGLGCDPWLSTWGEVFSVFGNGSLVQPTGSWQRFGGCHSAKGALAQNERLCFSCEMQFPPQKKRQKKEKQHNQRHCNESEGDREEKPHVSALLRPHVEDLKEPPMLIVQPVSQSDHMRPFLRLFVLGPQKC